MNDLLDAGAEAGGLIVGLLMTLFIFSYVLKDNPLYRLAVHLLVGVSAGYAVIVVFDRVIAPIVLTIIREPGGSASLGWVVPLLLAVLLLLKSIPRLSWIGNSAVAVMVAVGAAVAIVGAITGTLAPQIIASSEGRITGLVVAALTICVLFYFQFTFRSDNEGRAVIPKWFSAIRVVGKIVITITLAALFVGALNTSIVLLTGRVGYFIDSIGRVVDLIGL